MSHSDFIIIGGGIAGISAAAELSHHGKVTLIEAESALAYHASGRSAALYEPYYGPDVVVELSLASGQGLADAGVLSPRGVMLLAAKGDETGFAAEAETLQLRGIDTDQAVAMVPILNPAVLGCAALGDHAQDIDTDLLIQTLARAARGRGAHVLTGMPASRIQRQDGRWRVTTPNGDVTAPVLINAAGAWADQIAEMAGIAPVGITAKRRSMARIPVAAGLDPSGWPMLLGKAETWYAKPDAGAMIVSPADAEPVQPHDAWADDMTIAEGLARYEELVTTPVQRVLATWAGLRSFAPDGLPAFGRDTGQPDFVWFAGQGGYGFQSSIGSALFLGDLLSGGAVDVRLASALDPARFAR